MRDLSLFDSLTAYSHHRMETTRLRCDELFLNTRKWPCISHGGGPNTVMQPERTHKIL